MSLHGTDVYTLCRQNVHVTPCLVENRISYLPSNSQYFTDFHKAIWCCNEYKSGRKGENPNSRIILHKMLIENVLF